MFFKKDARKVPGIFFKFLIDKFTWYVLCSDCKENLVKQQANWVRRLEMDRDEILRRSRAEKEDEGNTFLENKGRRWGMVGFCAMTIVLLVFNLATGQNSYSVLAMFWSYIALEAWAKYRVSRRHTFLTVAVLAAFSSLCFLACHVLGVLR